MPSRQSYKGITLRGKFVFLSVQENHVALTGSWPVLPGWVARQGQQLLGASENRLAGTEPPRSLFHNDILFGQHPFDLISAREIGHEMVAGQRSSGLVSEFFCFCDYYLGRKLGRIGAYFITIG